LASRRVRRAPRVAPAVVRRRYAPHVLPLAAAVERELAEEFARQVAIVMREINPLLLRYGARRDAVSLSELWRLLRDRLRPEAVLRRLFGQVERETLNSLERRLPQLRIPAVVANGQQLAEQWVRRNIDLIKVEPRIQRAIGEVLAQPLDRGLRVEEIRAQLIERFGIEERRAQLIARDQTLKLAGQLQEERQTQAGIRRYVWTTSDDERVRPDHAELDGTIQSWDDPPVIDRRTGRRGHPGDDFQCRCNADPILDEP
jgi:SPP1 gp7 family putative phage head morphogenesis protein